MKAPRVWVTMSTLLALPAAALISAQAAKADPVSNYAAAMAPTICASLDNIPSVSNVVAILNDIIADTGFGPYQAGQIVGASVAVVCPWNTPVVQRFIATYSDSSQTYVAGGRVGGVIR